MIWLIWQGLVIGDFLDGDDWVVQGVDFFDVRFDDVFWLYLFLWFVFGIDVGGCVCGNDVIWFQGYYVVEVGDELVDVEQYEVCVVVLFFYVVYFGLQVEVVWICDFIGCDDVGIYWCEVVLVF